MLLMDVGSLDADERGADESILLRSHIGPTRDPSHMHTTEAQQIVALRSSNEYVFLLNK